MSGLPKKATDKVNTFGIVLIGVVTGVLLWVSVVALQAYYYSTSGDIEEDRGAANKGREMRDLKSKQRAELQDSKYVDPAKGKVTIPIDVAMAQVLKSQRDGAASLVPGVGAHDLPTIPARWGKPVDTQPVPPPGGAAPPDPTIPATPTPTPAPTPSPTPP